MDKVSYFLSANQYGDGKYVCLWRCTYKDNTICKIARFQNDEAARLFAIDFGFPLSEDLKNRLEKEIK